MARAVKAKRGRLVNNITHNEPTLSESEKADVCSFLNEMLRLMPVMGVHFFEISQSIAVKPVNPILQNTLNVADVVIVPAKADGFQSAFIDSQAWWSIRIGAKNRQNIKWIAAYQVSPIMAITHIAEIDQIVPYGDDGKYKLLFKGPAMELSNAIPYGNALSGTMQGPRYCTKAALDKAKTISDLF